MPLKKSIIPNIISEQHLYVLRPEDSAYQAANIMREQDISAILVVVDDMKLVGIVTERDMTRNIAAENRVARETKLEEIMTKSPATLTGQDSVFLALEKMRDMRVRHLPIIDDAATTKVVGIVSMRDVRHFIAHLPKQHQGLLNRFKYRRRWVNTESAD